MNILYKFCSTNPHFWGFFHPNIKEKVVWLSKIIVVSCNTTKSITSFCPHQSIHHIAPCDGVHHGRQCCNHDYSDHISSDGRGITCVVTMGGLLLTFPLPRHLQHLLVHVPMQLWQGCKAKWSSWPHGVGEGYLYWSCMWYLHFTIGILEHRRGVHHYIPWQRCGSISWAINR